MTERVIGPSGANMSTKPQTEVTFDFVEADKARLRKARWRTAMGVAVLVGALAATQTDVLANEWVDLEQRNGVLATTEGCDNNYPPDPTDPELQLVESWHTRT